MLEGSLPWYHFNSAAGDDRTQGGRLRISSDGDDRMRAKIKTQKNPSTKNEPPKKSHRQFPSLKKFPKAVNDIKRKISF